MLVINLSSGDLAYIGPACVLRLEWFNAEVAAVTVFAAGRAAVRSEVAVQHGTALPVGGRVVFTGVRFWDGRDTRRAKLAFEVPRDVRIYRQGHLLPAEHKAIREAAGVPETPVASLVRRYGRTLVGRPTRKDGGR